MARKDRNLAGFGKVANDETKNINNNDNINVNNNVNADIDANDDIDNILSKKATKAQTHTMRGIYFENEVVAVIDKMTAGKPKGAKSELVNAAVKKVFKEKGWL